MRNRRIALTVGVLVAALLAPPRPVSSQQSSSSGLDLDALDRTADACTDFYQFACGGWLATHPIPPGLAGIGRAREIRERTFSVLRGILINPGPDPERQKASDYYAACVDEASIEAKGVAPLEPVLSRIAAFDDRTAFPALLAFIHGVAYQPAIPLRRASNAALFDFTSQDDGLRLTNASLGQGGIALPDRGLYISYDERSRLIRERFRNHIASIFGLLGVPPAQADDDARATLAIETALAATSTNIEEQRALDSRRMSLAQVQSFTPHFDWTAYLKAADTPAFATIEVTATPEFLRSLDTIIAETPLADLKRYLQWQVVHASVLMLPIRFRQADFEFFKRALTGQQALEPRSELCMSETDDRLGDVLGQAFVDQAFGPRSKGDMLTIVAAVKSAMAQQIADASWMAETTKSAARAKLDAIIERIGYPDRWRNYSALRITKTDALANLQRALAFERADALHKIGRAVVVDEWPRRLTAARGETGYWPRRSEVIFPAWFLQRPLYDATRDAAANYGAIGAVVGHELTHAFDDVGRQVNSQGRHVDWWTAADDRAFQERASCVIDQYSGYQVADGTRVNGRLTLGENIADQGGIRLALMGYLAGPGATAPPILDGFTPTQRLFVGWAQVWCANVRPEIERLAIAVDPHAPNRYRVNGPLSNMPEFQEAFSCRPDAPMVRGNICRVW